MVNACQVIYLTRHQYFDRADPLSSYHYYAYMKCMRKEELVNLWRKLIVNQKISWALFENGTCVILLNSTEDLTDEAVNVLKRTDIIDFKSGTTVVMPGWLVKYPSNNEVMNYVSPEEVEGDEDSLRAGVLGRNNLRKDLESLKVIHIENNNP